jgi:hypothetical protein
MQVEDDGPDLYAEMDVDDDGGGDGAEDDVDDGEPGDPGDPPPPSPPPMPYPCSISAQTLDNYMLNTSAYNNKGLPIPSTVAARPLAAYGSTIMADAVADNVDPRLLVAIAFVETKFGALNCAGVAKTNNPFCLGGQKPIPFGSISDAIAFAANYLAGRIGPTTTVADLYNPTSGQKGYCNTAECTSTEVNTRLMQQGGGVGLPGVYGPLQSPCYLGPDGVYYQKQ